jgi:uncharacterized glyoxalase superfamily protein PhnB
VKQTSAGEARIYGHFVTLSGRSRTPGKARRRTGRISSMEDFVNEFECLIPILNVKNFAASMDYYVSKLGFSKKWDWGDPPSFGSVGRGKIEIFLSEGGQGQAGMWISIFVEDVDALHEEYKKSGAMIRQPPTNMPWGIREMNVQDPDGHRFRMGSHSEGPVDQEGWKRFGEIQQFGG